MSDVGIYRKVFVRLWRHPGYVALTRTGRELTLYLLSGPQTNRIGLFRFSVATAAEDLNVGAETFRERLADVQATFGWHFDPDARVFYIPSWWRWNQPQNANVLKGNIKDLSEIPPCALVEQFAQNLETLDPTLHQTFVEGCRIRLPQRPPIQKQYQDQKQDRKREQTKAATNNHDETLVTIAFNVVRDNPKSELENLIDNLQFLARSKGQTVKRQEAIELINLATSELRQARA